MLDRNKKRIRLGFAPTRRDMGFNEFCNTDSAVKQKNAIEAKLKQYGVDYVNLDFLNEDGLLFHDLDSEKVAKHFMAEGVDALFVPHCNFGNEAAVAKLADRLKKPVLLWGPRDEGPAGNGSRATDTQCGLFATSKILQRFGVPFTYITNCRLEDALFEQNFKLFIAAATTVKAFTNHLRIGQMSVRPEPFWSVKVNEAELLERFGIEIVPTSISDIQKIFNDKLNHWDDQAREVTQGIIDKFDRIAIGEDYLKRVVALKLSLNQWMDEQGLSAAAAMCWNPLTEMAGVAGCFVFSELVDDGIPVICETDIHGAVTAVMSQAARLYETPIFLADLTIRHPQNDNAELFWHCGVFPGSLAKKGCDSVVGKTFFDAQGAGNFEIAGGDYTISRFDGGHGVYSLLMGHGKGVEGPKTHGTYTWIEFKDWPKWEHKFIYGPYIHHCVGIHGNVAPVLYEACKYIPGLKADPVEPTEEEILKYIRG